MGAFHAPTVTGEALKTAVFCAALFEELGYEVTPGPEEERADIIQVVKLREREALLVEMDRAENPHDFVEKDIAFHAMVVDAAGSPALKKVWDSLRLVEWTGLSVAVTRNTLPELAKQHWRIFRLLERHADHTAGAYMFLHIKNFGDELKQHYQEMNGNILPLPGSAVEKERTT